MKLKHKKEIFRCFVEYNWVEILQLELSMESSYYIGFLFYLYLHGFIKRELLYGLTVENKYLISYMTDASFSNKLKHPFINLEYYFGYYDKRIKRLYWREKKNETET